jgi:hypothetical protein
MEHASIAAFARFALQLMSLGAPMDLVVATQQAMADETEHTALCFNLAGAYANQSVGPAALDVRGALDALSVWDIVRATVREGCIGETVAAVEAEEALTQATDPAVKDVLGVIARDEARHAALAWRFIAWAMNEYGDGVAAIAEEEIRSVMALREAELSFEPIASELAAHGVLSSGERVRLRSAALSGIVLPTLHTVARAAAPARYKSMSVSGSSSTGSVVGAV